MPPPFPPVTPQFPPVRVSVQPWVGPSPAAPGFGPAPAQLTSVGLLHASPAHPPLLLSSRASTGLILFLQTPCFASCRRGRVLWFVAICLQSSRPTAPRLCPSSSVSLGCPQPSRVKPQNKIKAELESWQKRRHLRPELPWDARCLGLARPPWASQTEGKPQRGRGLDAGGRQRDHRVCVCVCVCETAIEIERDKDRRGGGRGMSSET